MARLTFVTGVTRAMPPWLKRTRGLRLLEAIGEQIDDVVDRTAEGVRLRFPYDAPDPGALALTGRERRIRRGPGESAATYARRLRGWWDAHRTRGGPYALLGQLYAFFLDWLDVRMDVVYHSGTRRWIDTAGAITRDAITWEADGTDSWARFWVFFHVPALIPGTGDTLITDAGEVLITEAGESLVTDADISPSDLSLAEQDIFTAIPREWSAAHVDKISVVLLWGERRLWAYPQPVPTWTAWGASGALWGEPPVVLEITE